MARSINCPDCAVFLHFLMQSGRRDAYYADTGHEIERFVWGTPRVPMICDFCAKPLTPGVDKAVAHTVETSTIRIVPWEHEYLITEPPPAPSSPIT